MRPGSRFAAQVLAWRHTVMRSGIPAQRLVGAPRWDSEDTRTYYAAMLDRQAGRGVR